MPARNWDMNRRRAPVRARGGQPAGGNPRRQSDWRPPLAALGLLLPGLSADGFARLETLNRRSYANQEFKKRLHDLYGAERDRRAIDGSVTAAATTDRIHWMGLWLILEQLPVADVQALAACEVADDTGEGISGDAERLKSLISWMLSVESSAP